MGGLLFLLIVQSILIGALCSYVAGQKNRSKGNWFFLGVFFSLLALIALAAIPPLPKQEETKASDLPGETPSPPGNAASESFQPFEGKPDLSEDEYKIWLVTEYKIEKNEALGGFICNKKIYPSIDEALAFADEHYQSKLLEEARRLSATEASNALGGVFAAKNLAASGHTAAQISKELQNWRGLSPGEADLLAKAVTSDTSSLTSDQVQQMNLFGITYDGEKFHFLEYRYDRLTDAVNYAKTRLNKP